MSSVKSGLFSLANRAIQVLIAIGSMAILGRLLTPADFGLFSIVLAAQALYAPVLNLGLAHAYIREPQVNQNTANAFHSVNLLLGIINAIFLIISAPILSHFYHKPLLFEITIFFSGSILLNAMCSQRLTHLTREKRFDKLMIIGSVIQLGGLCAGIISAIYGLGVWALLIKSWTAAFLNNILTRIISSQKYYNSTYTQILKNISTMRFGIELTIARLLRGATLSADKLIFGKFFDIVSLGLYTKAKETAGIVDSHICMAVTTPAFSHLMRQDKKNRIMNYKLFCNLVLLIAVIPAGLCIVVGDMLMPFVMGKQWIAAGVYLQFLGVWGIGKVIQSIINLIYMTEGETKKLIVIEGMAFPIVLGFSVICALVGKTAIWFVIGLSLATLSYWMIILFLCLYQIEYNFTIFRGVGRTFLSIAIFLVIAGIFKSVIVNLFPDISQILTLFSVLAFSSVLVFPIQFIFNRKQLIEILLYIKYGLQRP